MEDTPPPRTRSHPSSPAKADSRTRARSGPLGVRRDLPQAAPQHRPSAPAVSTEPQFFRDPRVFETLSTKVIAPLVQRRRTIDIWCAAAASGQEPYSLAMVVRDRFPDASVRILATDGSRPMAERAAHGTYTELEVRRGLMPAMRSRHLVRVGAGWRVHPELRAMVQVEVLDLRSEWPPLRDFDLVLLRNVISYLNPETRRRVLSRTAEVLGPEGVLVLGAAEALDRDSGFEPVVLGRLDGYRPRRVG